ncbi:thymidine kinase [Francisella halioticida]|uniref:Thymidine kinase n=1 Tax=Francisella halioticida TaxID=549298 RepID=A0ABN5AXK7_9GAMM|nr:thymidine kinase [Francisella halioticida]ASG68255.1 thymidine kinase [Francisella halioticida]BCD91080.1 thymidine kinase [Francisella halioticida]
MAKLYFRYSSMDAGKTLDLLKVAYNYEDRGRKSLILTSAVDKRAGLNKVKSRIGIDQDAYSLTDRDNIYNFVQKYNQQTSVDCVLIDEIHFLKSDQVWQLSEIVDDLNIPVICYGLRTNYLGQPFETAALLLAIADTLEEVKTICHCGKKASFNMMVQNGQAIKEGDPIVVDDVSLKEMDIKYVSVCRKHWKKGVYR